MQPNGVNLWYFKLRLFDSAKVYNIELQRYRDKNFYFVANPHLFWDLTRHLFVNIWIRNGIVVKSCLCWIWAGNFVLDNYNPESEFNEFEPRLKSAKNRFQLSAGTNLEKLNTILNGTNHIWAAARILYIRPPIPWSRYPLWAFLF